MNINHLRIALIHPDYKNKVFETLSAPLGLAWISSSLKQLNKFQVDCFDFAKDKEFANFSAKDYDILCVQLHSQETLQEVLLWIENIKAQNDKLIIIAGGIAANLITEYILKNSCIDIISIGDGEFTICELCEAISNRQSYSNIKGIAYKDDNQQIIYTKSREINCEIDELPFPDREGFGLDYPQWSIITARGCPFSCKFCSMPKLYNSVRFRSISKVYEEIVFLYDNYGMRSFFIVDDTFTIERNRVIEFCSLMINDKRNYRWTCLTRADTLDEEVLTYMKKAGCVEISCGIESANDDIQNIIGKNLNISKSLKNLMLIKNIGIHLRCSFIFGLPGETISHIKNTIDFMERLKPNEIQIYPYVPYSGTEFYEYSQEYKLKMESLTFNDKKDLFVPYIDTELISKSEIVNLSKECIDRLRSIGYLWIPGDVPPKKQKLDYVVMTEFGPVQTLC